MTTETMYFDLIDILQLTPGDSFGDDTKMWFDKMSELLASDVIDSIERDGIVNPIVVNFDTGTIMNGHHRVAAAILLGITTIPVHSHMNYDWDMTLSDEPEWGTFVPWDGPVEDLPETGAARYEYAAAGNMFDGWDIGL